MTLCLTPAELESLTGKQRRSAQLRVLQALGIPARVRPDGSLLVLRSHVTDDAPAQNEPPSPQLHLS